jgi:hypothetical protein
VFFISKSTSSDMSYVPAYSTLKRWMDRYTVGGTSRLMPPYDDVLDVLKEFLRVIPVDEHWYKAQYPAIEGYLRQAPTETPSSHFRKHGYFEGRSPFAPGSTGLAEPVAFAGLKTRLRIIPYHGRLRVDIERADMLEIIKSLLAAVPIDESWYRATYPQAAGSIDDGTFPTATNHYAQVGYFEGYFPFQIIVDEKWYVSRYDHVKIGLERGRAKSAQDHFMRLGYQEGCRPTPP